MRLESRFPPIGEWKTISGHYCRRSKALSGIKLLAQATGSVGIQISERGQGQTADLQECRKIGS